DECQRPDDSEVSGNEPITSGQCGGCGTSGSCFDRGSAPVERRIAAPSGAADLGRRRALSRPEFPRCAAKVQSGGKRGARRGRSALASGARADCNEELWTGNDGVQAGGGPDGRSRPWWFSTRRLVWQGRYGQERTSGV